jgi:hypothetical protein
MRNNITGMLATVRDGLEFALTSAGASANLVLSDCRAAVCAAGETLERELSAKRFSLRYRRRIDALREAFDILLTDIDDARAIDDAAGRIFKGVSELTKELNAEKEVKKEIVFLPYKASMWDSLESIWEAARADERCHVSVVPIPYYDRNGRGDLAKRYCETELFPARAEAIAYEAFDIAAISPDIAYIHNPYDGGNLVTSVHPDCYSRELKKHVGTLVYVPYYASDSVPALSFAAPAAALAADILIASSEEDAAAYRRAGVRYRIAPLGSPKTDGILRMEREKPEIPEAWAKLRGKKVFFLNTSVASMLRWTDAYFQKLRALFDLFAERDDVALLWRPHPLTRATIGSMRPQLRAAYNALEVLVKKGRFGVIDLTPDMAVSLAISDAYIGDGASSLVYLYALTGKPLYILNFKMPAAPSEDALRDLLKTDLISAPCPAGGDLWVFCSGVNALCRFDFEAARAEYVSSVPDEKNRGGLYGTPAGIGGKLLLPPVLAREWALYDTETGAWEKHPIPDRYRPIVRNGACFATALETEDLVIFRPIHSTAFVKYDKASGKFEYRTDWYKKFEPHVFNAEWGLLNGCTPPIDDALFFTSPQGNILLELDIRSMKTTIHRVGDARNRYFGIAYDGECFWLSKYMPPGTRERQNAVVRLNRRTGSCKEYPLAPVTFDPLCELSDFGSVFFFEGEIWVFPYGAGEIFRIDPKTENISVFETGLPYALGDRKSPYHAYADGVAGWLYFARGDDCPAAFSRLDKCLVFLSLYDNSLLFINAATGAVRKQSLVVEGIGELLKNPDLVPPYLYGESAFLTNGDFAERVRTGAVPAFDAERAAYHRGVCANTDGSSGEKIHAFAMGYGARGARG